jgi:DNA-binding transcriptional MerR regulator
MNRGQRGVWLKRRDMFQIGEFSNIARVSGVLLRHYDQIGLFKPAHVNPENGYRYYTIEQLPALNRILALRDLGLALEQIKRLVHDNVSPAEIRGMLQLRQAEIEQTVDAEQARLRRVRSRLKEMEGLSQDRHEVVLKSLPAEHFLSIREPVPYLPNAGTLFYEVGGAVLEQAASLVTYCMAIFHDPVFRDRDTDFELGYLLRQPQALTLSLSRGRALTVKPLDPIDQALTCVHAGPWSEIHLGFAAIGRWLAANKTQIAGKPRELYLNLVPPEEDDKLVVEIQMPVKPV